MKKFWTVLILLGVMLAAAACGKQETTSPTGQADSEAYDPSQEVDFERKTSEEEHIVTVGTIDKSLYQTPILVTSFGQSTDAATIDTALSRAGVEYTYKPQAKADEVAAYKTVMIAVGASTKGLGSAGISESEETARAEAIMAKIKETGAEVILIHIGGATRRGVLSDKLTDMVLPQCSYIILKEDANWDYKFTKYAEEHNLPITLIYATKDTVQVMTDLFSK